jgi:uncharacterized protein (TIGR00725 family)
VVGPGSAIGPDLDELAAGVGRVLAERGAVLVCGGMSGVMEAACRGAREGGGTAVGILPGLDRADANPHVSIAIPTGLGEARNVLVVRAADVVIALAGEFGTLSEIAFALKTGKPVVGVGTWELVKEGRPDDSIRRAASASEAVELALRLA